MKKFFLLFAVLGLFTFSANAQKKACSMANKASCAKTCTKSKTASVAANTPAAILAAQDDSIEKRVCSKSGAVSYVKKNVCSHSGNVSFTDVEYSTETKKFINVSPSDMEVKAAPNAVKTSAAPSCSKSKKASCSSKASCTKGKTTAVKTSAVKATKVSKVTTAKKACSKKSAACCAKGGKKAVSAKLVNNEK